MPLPSNIVSTLVSCGLIVPVRDLCIVFPGGATICIQFPSVKIPDPMELIIQLFAQINAALAPLMPFLKLLECVLVLVDAVKAVPQSIFPPNPQPIIEVLVKLGKCVADLLKLIPLISLPFTIAAILDALILFLVALKTQLETIILTNAALISAATSAIDPTAAAIIACEQQNMASYLSNLNEMMRPLNTLLGVINLLLTLIGQDPIPPLSNIGTDAQAFLGPLTDIIATLRVVRSFLPV